jgi:hypothetical protein
MNATGWASYSRAEFKLAPVFPDMSAWDAQSVPAHATPYWRILPTSCPTDERTAGLRSRASDRTGRPVGRGGSRIVVCRLHGPETGLMVWVADDLAAWLV